MACANRGRVNSKVAPWSLFGVAHNRPPCASTIVRLIESPSPIPSFLVVKNAWNKRPTASGDKPVPQSRILIFTAPSSQGKEEMASSLGLSLANCYFAHDSPEFQRNVTMLHCVENR